MKVPRIFGHPMVSLPPFDSRGDVHHWELRIGKLTVVLDPDVIGAPPYQSPTWELSVQFYEGASGLRKKEASAIAENRLRELRDELTRLIDASDPEPAASGAKGET